MGDARQLSRKSLRGDQLLEFHLEPMPEPPPAMLKLPGVREWYASLRLMRERDNAMFYRLVNNLGISRAPNSS